MQPSLSLRQKGFPDGFFHFRYFFRFEVKIFVLLDTQVRKNKVVRKRDVRILEACLGTADGATFYCDHLRNIARRLDESAKLPADSSQAKHFAKTFPGQFNGCPVR